MPKVTMPQLGESVAEGTIGKWLKQVGDHVDKYEPIVEVITDKVNAEVPSPFEGTLTAILVQEGETVPNNAEIAVIEGAGEAAATTAPAAAAPPARPAPAATVAPTGAGAAQPASGNGSGDRTVLGLGTPGPAGSDERSVEELRQAA
ncbi:MAG: biotin/lipoyl-containing protein, partial [Candidatus Limnocylindrales bacterium]